MATALLPPNPEGSRRHKPSLVCAGAAALAAALLLGLFLSVACGGGRQGEPLVVALSGDLPIWNPYVDSDAAGAPVLDLVFPRLVHERPPGSSPEFAPYLAQRWELSEDGLRLTFHLRQDARWSDGTPIDCEDVRFTLEVQRSEALAWPGIDTKRNIESVECPDPATAVFLFRKPSPHPVMDANDDAIVPRAFAGIPFEKWSSTDWSARLVTAGPYRVLPVASPAEAILERDPLFWDAGQVRVPRVVIRVYADRERAAAALLAGEVDLLADLPPAMAEQVARSPATRLVDLPGWSWSFVAWNTLEPGAYLADRRARGCGGDAPCPESPADIHRLRREHPHPILADPRVRRALTLASDREDLVNELWAGHARPAASPIVSALGPAHDPTVLLPFDPAAAEALLEQAGWHRSAPGQVREKAGRDLELRVIVNADNRRRRDALERIAANLKLVGVRLTEEPLPRREFVARARDKAFDGACLGWRAGTRIEPWTILHSRAAPSRGYNLGSWSTPASDQLLDEIRETLDARSALPLLRRWQQIFKQQQPYTPLYEERSLIGLSRRVTEARSNALDPLAEIWTWRVEPAPGRTRR